MEAWPVSQTVKQLKSFMDLTSYYRRYVNNYRVITKPLNELLKKDKFSCSEKAQHAFEVLKNVMIQFF